MKALSTRLFALNEAWKENANIYRQMAKQMNLTDMAMWALYTLRVEPGEMTQSRMSEFLHEPKQTINSALKKMEADGLITLQSGSNRRTKTIHLTAAGEALARETADRVAETEQQALSQFSEEEANQLFSLMRRLNACKRHAKRIDVDGKIIFNWISVDISTVRIVIFHVLFLAF